MLDREPSHRDIEELTPVYVRELPEAVASSESTGSNRESSNCWKLASEGIPLGMTTGNIDRQPRSRWSEVTSTASSPSASCRSDSPNRAELTLHAIKRGVVTCATGSFPNSRPQVLQDDFIAVGDTPDVSAAHEAGIRMVSVATGLFDLETLKQRDPVGPADCRGRLPRLGAIRGGSTRSRSRWQKSADLTDFCHSIRN